MVQLFRRCRSHITCRAFHRIERVRDWIQPDPVEGTGSVAGVAAGGAGAVYIPVNFAIGKNPVAWAKLQLNGHDRFAGREGRYFNLVQPYQHHENVPVVGINVYSFGLKPEEHQPSGTCNFSRIDNATLQLALTAASVAGNQGVSIRVYAVNYNVKITDCVEKVYWKNIYLVDYFGDTFKLAGNSLEPSLPLVY